MRVLIICDSSTLVLGGVAVETKVLVRGLHARGHEVAFLGDVVQKDAGAVKHFPLPSPLDETLPGRFQEIINTFKPEVIHITDMGGRGLLRIAPILSTLPSVLTLHAIPPYENMLQSLHWNDSAHYAIRSLVWAPNVIAWKWFLRKGSIPHVIVHCQQMAEIVERYGQPKERISLIPLGCDIPDSDSFPSKQHSGDQLRLLTIAGLYHTKGHHDALVALADLRRDFPGLVYEIIGEIRDDTYANFLRQMLRELALDNCVRLLINATDKEKKEALERADLYLQPSHEEGFCLAY